MCGSQMKETRHTSSTGYSLLFAPSLKRRWRGHGWSVQGGYRHRLLVDYDVPLRAALEDPVPLDLPELAIRGVAFIEPSALWLSGSQHQDSRSWAWRVQIEFADSQSVGLSGLTPTEVRPLPQTGRRLSAALSNQARRVPKSSWALDYAVGLSHTEPNAMTDLELRLGSVAKYERLGEVYSLGCAAEISTHVRTQYCCLCIRSCDGLGAYPMKLRQQKSLIFGVVFGTLLIASQSALGSKPDSLGYSAVGLGHATTMNGPSWTLAATHPAGLLSCTEKTLSHGYTFSQFSKEIESQTTRTQTAQGFEGGLCLPSRLINLDTVIGLTWFLPNQHITSLRTQSPRGPMMVFFEDRLDRLAIVSSIALGERDVWGVGLGIEHLATTVGTIQLSGELLLDETEQPNLEGTIDFLFESKRRLLASAWVKLLPSLHWGIAYAAPLGLTVDLDLDFDGDVSSSPGAPLLEDVSLLLASHLYAYGTPPKWSSHLQLDHGWASWLLR